MFFCFCFCLFALKQLQQHAKNKEIKPHKKGWLERLSQNAMWMVVSSLNSAGDQLGIVGAWTNMALKYRVLKYEGNQTAVRKVTWNRTDWNQTHPESYFVYTNHISLSKHCPERWTVMQNIKLRLFPEKGWRTVEIW